MRRFYVAMDTGNRHWQLARTLAATAAIYLVAPLVIAVVRPGMKADLIIALGFGIAGVVVGFSMIYANTRRILGAQVGRIGTN